MSDEARQVIARWESRSGKHWVELSEDRWGFAYTAPGQGGVLGRVSRAEAVTEIERRAAMGLFQPDANVTPMRRTR